VLPCPSPADFLLSISYLRRSVTKGRPLCHWFRRHESANLELQALQRSLIGTTPPDPLTPVDLYPWSPVSLHMSRPSFRTTAQDHPRLHPSITVENDSDNLACSTKHSGDVNARSRSTSGVGWFSGGRRLEPWQEILTPCTPGRFWRCSSTFSDPLMSLFSSMGTQPRWRRLEFGC
jgi:hypothetical protein